MTNNIIERVKRLLPWDTDQDYTRLKNYFQEHRTLDNLIDSGIESGNVKPPGEIAVSYRSNYM